VDTSASTVLVEKTPEAAAKRAAECVSGIIASRTAVSDNCHIALCGGTTPGELYRLLAGPEYAENIPWEKIQIFFGDERDVPQDHVENNYRMVTRALLDHVPVPLERVHPCRPTAWTCRPRRASMRT